MATISITEAARRWAVSRQTIYNRISEGKLSAEKDRSGNTLIDVAELLRVFGEPDAAEQRESNAGADAEPAFAASVSLAQQLEIERLRNENLLGVKQSLEQQVRTLQGSIERLERREDERERREEEREKRLLLAIEAVSTAKESLSTKLTQWLSNKKA